jgi:DNA-binding beta-propeller fold protein YncE
MSSNRVLVIVVAVVLLILIALGAFFLYLSGAGRGDSDAAPASETGLVPVRVIDNYEGRIMPKPVGVGAASDGGFFVAVRDSQQIVEFDAQGDYVRSWGKRGLQVGEMLTPLGVAVDRAGGRVYVVDRARLRLLCYDPTGQLRWERPVLYPVGVTVTDDGVAVTTFGPVVRFDAEGQLMAEVGSRGFDPGQFDFPRSIAMTDDDAFIITDSDNRRVQRVQLSGTVTATVDWVLGTPPLSADDGTTRFTNPTGVAIDNQGRAFVLDGFADTIDVLDATTGEELHTFELFDGRDPGQFELPTNIAYLGNQTFAITDTYNDRVQIVRLLVPEENNFVARNPWLRWLLLLLLLPLLPLFGRKRAYVTAETLDRAATENRLRLLAAVYQRLYVLPDVHEAYADRVEEGVAISEYLVPIEVSMNEGDDPEVVLSEASRPSRLKRILLPRHRVLCVDVSQCARVAELKAKPYPYERVVEEYALDFEAGAEGPAEGPVDIDSAERDAVNGS